MTSDRFASISELLTSQPARRPARVHTLNPEPLDQAPALPKPAQGRASRKSRESTGGTRRIAFRIDPDLHARLVAHAKGTDTTHGNLVLDAIEAAHNNGTLGQLVTAARSRPALQSAGLFVRTLPRGSATASVPVEIQLNAQAVDQIDHLVDQHGAETRTQLITAALKDYLS